jgi:hypothetical protein
LESKNNSYKCCGFGKNYDLIMPLYSFEGMENIEAFKAI